MNRKNIGRAIACVGCVALVGCTAPEPKCLPLKEGVINRFPSGTIAGRALCEADVAHIAIGDSTAWRISRVNVGPSDIRYVIEPTKTPPVSTDILLTTKRHEYRIVVEN